MKKQPRRGAAVPPKHKIDKRLHPSPLDRKRDDQPETRPISACPSNRMRPERQEPSSFDRSGLRLHQPRPASAYRTRQPVVEFLGLGFSLKDPGCRENDVLTISVDEEW